ncbi:MAG: radical SAM protein [Anaerolineae bacterium]|nr:radical SAM protein [Anaerolineae bacterium]
MVELGRRVLDGLVRRLVWPWDRPPVKPRQVIIDITDRCYFRCITCDRWQVDAARAASRELSTAAWQHVFRVLRAWLGPFHLSISGGEPLVREDILDLIASASGLGCTINMMSNGWQVDAHTAAALVRAGLGNLTLSLNGSSAETHDVTRGRPGSYARVAAAVEHFNRARVAVFPSPTLSLNVIAAGYNAHELPDLVRWAHGAGIDAVGVQPLAANYRPYELGETPAGEPAPPVGHPLWRGEIDAAIGELIDLKRQGYPVLNPVRQLALMRTYFANGGSLPRARCYVGLDNFLIDPYGMVRLCYEMGAIGDIRVALPRDIWYGALAASVRRRIRVCGRGCRVLGCNYRSSGFGFLEVWA